MLQTLVVLLALVVAGILVYASMQPDDFRIERTGTIKAPPERIYPHLADFHLWSAWSPWEKKDPAMKRDFSGPASGTGTAYGWEGNKDVGTGRMTITDCTESTRVVIRLEFLKPFKATNMAELTLQQQGDATAVTWAMFGKANFMSKVMCTFMSMDKMVGPDFKAGLANLKAVAERPAP
ncbi:MAG: SRPBCC family protein [Betaproteobacteria bacterium]|nr:SRPBCC family protein [Betaproteobacteria bacterium]